jgi:hypothetical protein
MKKILIYLVFGLAAISAGIYLKAQNSFPLQHWPRPYFTSINGTWNWGNAYAGSTSAGQVSNAFSTTSGNQFVIMTPDQTGTGGSSAGITTRSGAVILDLRSGQVSWYLDNGGTPVTALQLTTTGAKSSGVALTPTAFASIPACAAGTEGSLAEVNNSNTAVWGATIAAGGTNKVLAHCNGTNWTVAGD